MRKKQQKEGNPAIKFSPSEEKYFTQLKMRINYEKHFQEDEKFKPDYVVPYKTLRYIRKLAMRDELAKLTPQAFLEDDQYKAQQIWDIKYISTSDEEDNDSSEHSSSAEGSGSGAGSEDEDEKKKEEVVVKNAKTLEEVKIQIDQSQAAIEDAAEKEKKGDEDFNEDVLQQDPKKLWKLKLGKNDNVPEIAQKLRPTKKKQRIYYAYTYDNKTEEGGSTDPKKVKVIRKRVERR